MQMLPRSLGFLHNRRSFHHRLNRFHYPGRFHATFLPLPTRPIKAKRQLFIR
jgi:hypothetical protein